MVDDFSVEDDTAAAADISTVGTDFGGTGTDVAAAGANLSNLFDGLQQRGGSLVSIANSFARAMTAAFTQSSRSGQQFENVLKSLALRISSMAVSQALRPLTSGLFGGSNQLFGGLFGGDGGGGGGSGGLTSFGEFAAAMGAIKPFAAGGVIGTPTYFPLTSGGFGLAGEAGPEAILPLTRGPDGRLGVGSGGRAAPANVTVQIMTPDAESFRRSEIYLTGQIARAVARGQRSL